MCYSCFSQAREVADELLRTCYGVDLSKALDPTKAKDYLVIEQRLADAVQAAARGAEAAALRAALNELDVDWRTISAAGRAKVLGAAKSAAKKAVAPAATAAKVEKVLIQRGGKVLRDTKAAAAKAIGRVGFDVNRVDERILRKIATNQAAFVRDELGSRASNMVNRKARGIVAAGLKRGLGRDAMMHELRGGLGGWAAVHSDNYWSTVGNYMANTARSYGSLSTWREAGITEYEAVAVIDRSTTPMCRLMNGKVFTVQRAMDNIANATVERPLPWLYEGKDGAGKPSIYYKDSDGARHTIARIGSGGKFSGEASAAELQDAGIDSPPYHAHCRTTIVARVA